MEVVLAEGKIANEKVFSVGKIAPGLMKQATGEIGKIAQNKINQVIKSGGAEVERMLPKIIHEAIEDVYKTPFRILGNFGKQQFNRIEKKVFTLIYYICIFISMYNKPNKN